MDETKSLTTTSTETLNDIRSLFSSVLTQAKAKDTSIEMDDERRHVLKLVLGYANTYLRAQELNQRSFIIESLQDKIAIVKDNNSPELTKAPETTN